MNPLHKAIERYKVLIDDLAQETDRHFVALGDPNFEGVRFYTFSSLRGNFNYDEATELGADVVDGIEEYLMQVDGSYTLLTPILTKLKSVAAFFNIRGYTVFLGSWGMGPGEIGWMIRKINNPAIFERYLQSAGISEEAVDAYNQSYQQELEETNRITQPMPAGESVVDAECDGAVIGACARRSAKKMQKRTKVALGSVCLVAILYIAWLLTPNSWSIFRSGIRDAGIIAGILAGSISLFSLPAGYSNTERQSTPTQKLWWIYFLLLPAIPWGLACGVWLLYWI